uniref:Uncharacterized protein n=1 Tax=Pithovirus LCPAC001 TaxID=2506585 RepID=A0A481Z4W6_9VIRU|nr:MAG: hypothetical protein LCPAC001_01930 [Pithovirus LCPAC001]
MDKSNSNSEDSLVKKLRFIIKKQRGKITKLESNNNLIIEIEELKLKINKKKCKINDLKKKFDNFEIYDKISKGLKIDNVRRCLFNMKKGCLVPDLSYLPDNVIRSEDVLTVSVDGEFLKFNILKIKLSTCIGGIDEDLVENGIGYDFENTDLDPIDDEINIDNYDLYWIESVSHYEKEAKKNYDGPDRSVGKWSYTKMDLTISGSEYYYYVYALREVFLIVPMKNKCKAKNQ